MNQGSSRSPALSSYVTSFALFHGLYVPVCLAGSQFPQLQKMMTRSRKKNNRLVSMPPSLLNNPQLFDMCFTFTFIVLLYSMKKPGELLHRAKKVFLCGDAPASAFPYL